MRVYYTVYFLYRISHQVKEKTINLSFILTKFFFIITKNSAKWIGLCQKYKHIYLTLLYSVIIKEKNLKVNIFNY